MCVTSDKPQASVGNRNNEKVGSVRVENSRGKRIQKECFLKENIFGNKIVTQVLTGIVMAAGKKDWDTGRRDYETIHSAVGQRKA